MIGIDVSHHNYKIDWDKAKAEGVRFAFIRAMFGHSYDTQFDRNWAEAKRVGIVRSAYGWCLHGFDQKDNAQRFVDRLSDLGELPPVVDFENSETYGNPTFAELKRFLNEVGRLSGI